jgi:signal transduction histidine kinase
MQSLPMPDFCRQSIDLWRKNDANSNRTVHFIDRTEESSGIVLGDFSKLQQVMVNLLDNAAQHSPDDTDLRVIVNATERDCTVGIKDQGKGIDPEVLPHLFEPFFTTRKGGTGLGLGIVKNIISLHDGTIQVRNNTPEPGCTVEFCLPLVRKKIGAAG